MHVSSSTDLPPSGSLPCNGARQGAAGLRMPHAARCISTMAAGTALGPNPHAALPSQSTLQHTVLPLMSIRHIPHNCAALAVNAPPPPPQS